MIDHNIAMFRYTTKNELLMMMMRIPLCMLAKLDEKWTATEENMDFREVRVRSKGHIASCVLFSAFGSEFKDRF